MTYSIVARDSKTGELGIGVQSNYFQAGLGVPWARSGVGAVATQANSGWPGPLYGRSHGPLGLRLLRGGYSPEQAIPALLRADPQPEFRQIGMVDASGRVAAHTGSRCVAEAGHQVGDGYCVLANIMLRTTVWGAMAEAFENAGGPLAERMLAALDAAEREGGDIRGKQSAALMVVAGSPSGRPWEDRRVDIRVEDSPEPLIELRRLLGMRRAWEAMFEADAFASKKDRVSASERRLAALNLVPESAQIRFLTGLELVAAGRADEGLELMKAALVAAPQWLETLRRYVVGGRVDPDLAERVERMLEPKGPKGSSKQSSQ